MKSSNKINSFILGITTIAVLTSCEDTIPKTQYEQEVAQLNSTISSDQRMRDSIEGVYIATLDEIDNNLDKIREKEGIIIMGPKNATDLRTSKRERIVTNISMINTLIEENKTKLSQLEKSLASYKKGKKELLRSVNLAKERMVLLEEEITELKSILAENEFKIAELNKQLDDKNDQLANLSEKNTSLDKDLNRVYFAEGTYKELRGKNIVIKEGGLLGLGRVETLKQNLDKSQFKELSQKETTSIVLNGKKPKLITKHPVSSYTVSTTENDLAQLTIKDPERFWSYSKFLVVEVK
jgi:chromosome segregation ATPase